MIILKLNIYRKSYFVYAMVQVGQIKDRSLACAALDAHLPQQHVHGFFPCLSSTHSLACTA